MKRTHHLLRFFQRFIPPRQPFPKKRVLVLEGGGMRGIFLTGVLQAFTDHGYFPWKIIIGTSAGALTGTAYAAGQIYLARDAFFTTLLSTEFIRLINIIKPEKNILDLDWMVDTIISGDDPLDLKKLKKSCPVLITATHCGPDTPPVAVYLNSQKDTVPVALKATAAIPFLYRDYVAYKNYNLLDGAVLDAIPYKKALEMGYREEDILVVVTRPKGYRKKERSFWAKKLYESYYKDPKHKFLLKALENQPIRYNNLLDDIENRHTGIEVICPPEDFRVNRLTKDPEKIVEGFSQGVTAGKAFMFKKKQGGRSKN